MSYVIARREAYERFYFSPSAGLMAGNPAGGWSSDKDEAKTWDEKAEAKAYLDRHLTQLHVDCEVVEL